MAQSALQAKPSHQSQLSRWSHQPVHDPGVDRQLSKFRRIRDCHVVDLDPLRVYRNLSRLTRVIQSFRPTTAALIGCGVRCGRSTRSMGTVIARSDGCGCLRSGSDGCGCFRILFRYKHHADHHRTAALDPGDDPTVQNAAGGDQDSRSAICGQISSIKRDPTARI